MNGQKILNIAATIIVAFILWTIVSKIFAAVAAPIIVLLVYILKLFIIVAAISCIIKFLGLKLKK